MARNPNPYRAELCNSAGTIDQIEAPRLEDLRQEIAHALKSGNWLIEPGDTIRITGGD
jgi:hypothetical protein